MPNTALAQITSYNEKEILLQVAAGNETAFGELYRYWQPQLAFFILRFTGSKELTAEIVQDVFLKLWLSREALTDIGQFKSYLFVMSRHHAINAFRKTMRELRQSRDWEQSQSNDTGDKTEDPLLSVVDEAIEQLSPRQKEVYLLHRHQRLTYLQIAEKLGIGRESVKTHLELAVKAITKYLQQRMILAIAVLELISKKI